MIHFGSTSGICSPAIRCNVFSLSPASPQDFYLQLPADYYSDFLSHGVNDVRRQKQQSEIDEQQFEKEPLSPYSLEAVASMWMRNGARDFVSALGQ